MSLHDLVQTEIDLTKVLFNMERRGILTDYEYCAKALTYEQEMMQEAAFQFTCLTGQIYKDSNKLFAKIFEERGDEYPLTAKGNPSFNADSLAEVNTPVARAIKKYRNHEKRAGTYYSSFLYYGDDFNYIHASANQAGTTSGRLSYSNPNLQNVPKEDNPEDLEKEFVVRGSFIPTPGNKLISIDYSQQEYRVMLDYAGETRLIDQVMAGADVHQATADLMGVRRNYAKTINFALLYGAGIEKLAKMLNIPKREAEDLKYLYFAKLPKVKRFLNNVKNTGEARGYVYNWAGRRCNINSFDESYKLPNHLIQGSCADVVKMAMVRIEKELGNVGMAVQVHDELLLDMPVDKLELIPKIVQIMESIYEAKNGIVLTTSCAYSDKSWAYRDFTEGQP